MTTIEKWNKIIQWQQANVKGRSWAYNPPASSENLLKIERLLGEKLPQNYLDLYHLADGQKDDGGNWMLLGAMFFETSRTIQSLEFANENAITYPTEQNDFGESSFTSTPEGAIKKKYYHVKWLPVFASNGQSDYIGIDFDPDVNGKKGQIITFGRDTTEMCVIADDLDSFFDLILEVIDKEGQKFIDYVFVGNGEVLERLLWEAKGYKIPAHWQSLEERVNLYR
jgi:cell wall assembly regulator SMI1